MIALSKEELQKESEIESDFEHPKRRRGHGRYVSYPSSTEQF